MIGLLYLLIFVVVLWGVMQVGFHRIQYKTFKPRVWNTKVFCRDCEHRLPIEEHMKDFVKRKYGNHYTLHQCVPFKRSETFRRVYSTDSGYERVTKTTDAEFCNIMNRYGLCPWFQEKKDA